MDGWLAGFAEFDITPPPGVRMTGYAGRPGPADHVLDRLHVRALALAQPGNAPVVLTCTDLLGITDEMVRAIRAAVSDTVPAARLLLNHSHTHAGPTTSPLRCMGTADASYCDLVVRWTAGAVGEAVRALRPAALAFGIGTTAIGRNRRELRDGRIVPGHHPDGAYDPQVYVLRVEAGDGSPLACWFSHAAHPVVMGSSNTGISAEWPGAAAEVLARALGCPALFAQGCCGDVNPFRRGDYAVVRSVGRELAGAALTAWERAEPVSPEPGLAAALETTRLPQRKPEHGEASAELARARERLATVENEIRTAGAGLSPDQVHQKREAPAGLAAWAEDYAAAAQAEGGHSVGMEVQALRLGDVALVATGAETFVEIGQQLQRRSPLPRTVALGYSNGCIGYLPTAKAFPLGGYEIETAYKYYGTLMLTPDCERLTLEAAERVLRAVGPRCLYGPCG